MQFETLKESIGLTDDQPTQEMFDWFYKRTERHVNLVVKYIDIIYNGLIKNADKDLKSSLSILQLRKFKHDADKGSKLLMLPYVWISWKYKQKRDNNIDIKINSDMKREMDKATEYHVLNNPHHPECSAGVCNNDPNDRDKSTEPIDASNMYDEDVIEMVADWSAMAEELHDTPRNWYNKCSGVRWTFTANQQALIEKCLNIVEQDSYREIDELLGDVND